MSSQRAMVASGHPLVSQAALEILEEGGNAFDAVVAAGFMAPVAEQTLTSLGGGGFLMAKTVDTGEITLFDFFSDTPGKGRNTEELEPHFFPVTIPFGGCDQDFNIGLGSVAVPGNLKGFLHVHGKLGLLPLEKIVEPARKAAITGVRLNQLQARFLNMLKPIMTFSEFGRNLYCYNDRYMTEGDMYHNPEMAAFLEIIANGEGDSFYTGEIAEKIATDMANGGGLLTMEDLASYKVIERQPLETSYRDFSFFTNPPPSFGGTLICAALQYLDGVDFSDITWGSRAHVGQLSDLMVKIEEMWEIGIDTIYQGLQNADQDLRMNSRGTTHVSIIDCQGNAASMTSSNGEGSGYFAPGTGVMLNNMMGEDDLHPEGFHSSPPGMRVASMMSPSLLEKDNQVVMALGSGGSKRIRTAITQVISHILDFGLSTKEAVDAPRMHWDGDILQLEPGYQSESVDHLKNKMAVNHWQGRDVYFGGVHAVSKEHGGAGDPRRAGETRERSCG